MPAVFGMTALRFSVAKLLCSKCPLATRRVQCAFWLSANPPQGIATSAPVDRRTARRGRRATIDEQFLALHMGGIVRGEEQHRLRDVLGFAEAAERCRQRDAFFKSLFGFRRGNRR